MARPNKPQPRQANRMVSTKLLMAKIKGNLEPVLSENMGSSHTNR
jgi:hypothetical protein